MSNKHLSRKPQNINRESWYYEEPSGIEIIYQVGNNFYHINIPWRKLRNSLKRKDKKEVSLYKDTTKTD